MSDVLPTLILIGIVYGLYRWLTGPRTPRDPLRGVKRDMVEAVTAAFPDVSIESVVYSLSRTGSAQTTSEIILERGSLPPPPVGFTVPDRLRPVSVPSPSASAASSTPAPAVKAQSLIDRYNLGAKATAAAAAAAAAATGADTAMAPVAPAGGKWEATREDREKDLRARKERMILEARKRMLEKQAAAVATAEKGADGIKTE